MTGTSVTRHTRGGRLIARAPSLPRSLLRLATGTGGGWPSLARRAALGLLGVGLISCGAPPSLPPRISADWYTRCGASETVRTGWLSETAYLAAAADQRLRRCYPVAIMGGFADAAPARRYRATFFPRPDNIADWRASIGASPGADARLDAALVALGYVRVWHDAAAAANGQQFVQGIWTKRK